MKKWAQFIVLTGVLLLSGGLGTAGSAHADDKERIRHFEVRLELLRDDFWRAKKRAERAQQELVEASRAGASEQELREIREGVKWAREEQEKARLASYRAHDDYDKMMEEKKKSDSARKNSGANEGNKVPEAQGSNPNRTVKLPRRCAEITGATHGVFTSKNDMARQCADAALNYHAAVAQACDDRGQEVSGKGKAAGDSKKVKAEWKNREGECKTVTQAALEASKEALAATDDAKVTNDVCGKYKDLYNGGKPDGEIESLCAAAKKRAGAGKPQGVDEFAGNDGEWH